MELIKTIAVYIISIPLVGLTGNLFLIPVVIIGKRFLKNKPLNLTLSFLVDVGANIFLCYLIYLLCNLLKVQIVWAMWILPSFITIMADYRRIDRVKSGHRMAEASFQVTGEIGRGSKDFQTFLMRSEYAHLTGDYIGLLLGGIVFFRGAPLI